MSETTDTLVAQREAQEESSARRAEWSRTRVAGTAASSDNLADAANWRIDRLLARSLLHRTLND